jgi:DNA-directed RNA polymerase subunit RPC12/RpoP
MEEKQLAITCPLCGRSSNHALSELREGADMVCPLCGVKLNLHGHMWEEIKKEIDKLK